LKIVILLAAYT